MGKKSRAIEKAKLEAITPPPANKPVAKAPEKAEPTKPNQQKTGVKAVPAKLEASTQQKLAGTGGKVPQQSATATKPIQQKPGSKTPEKGQKAQPAPQPVAPPPPPVKVEPPIVKRPRFVREKKEKKPEVKATPLPPRSNKLTAKLMSKNLALPPKVEPNLAGIPKP